jgi:hypothetical protein
VSGPDGTPRSYLSGSKYQANHQLQTKLADFLLWWTQGAQDCAGVLEMKSRNPRPTDVAAQLQEAADLLAQLSVDYEDVRFAAMLAKKEMPAVAYRELSKKRVQFRGKAHPIHLVDCGGSLGVVASRLT